jgi:hypothetical protein
MKRVFVRLRRTRRSVEIRHPLTRHINPIIKIVLIHCGDRRNGVALHRKAPRTRQLLIGIPRQATDPRAVLILPLCYVRHPS